MDKSARTDTGATIIFFLKSELQKVNQRTDLAHEQSENRRKLFLQFRDYSELLWAIQINYQQPQTGFNCQKHCFAGTCALQNDFNISFYLQSSPDYCVCQAKTFGTAFEQFEIVCDDCKPGKKNYLNVFVLFATKNLNGYKRRFIEISPMNDESKADFDGHISYFSPVLQLFDHSFDKNVTLIRENGNKKQVRNQQALFAADWMCQLQINLVVQ